MVVVLIRILQRNSINKKFYTYDTYRKSYILEEIYFGIGSHDRGGQEVWQPAVCKLEAEDSWG